MRFLVFVALAATVSLFPHAVVAGEIDPTVPTYHGDAARSGHYVVPGLTWATTAGLRLDESFDGRVSGNIYAQPLYWHPAGAASGQVIVATEDNVVAALDAITGRTVWQRSLGPAVPLSTQSYGNIHPLGITGTPVIDEHSSALFLDAVIKGANGARHLVFGLSLTDGAILPGWPVDTATSLGAIGMTFDPKLQNQRGALALVGDRLYVPYAGHYGAYGDYRGWVVGLRLDKPAVFGAWRSTNFGAPNWAPGGIAYDGQYLFVSTGPAKGETDHWTGGEAVIRLTPDLVWQPTDQNSFSLSERGWEHDLGISNPLPVDLPGGGPNSVLLIVFARNGTMYLLDRAKLGGLDRPLKAQQVASFGVLTSPAAYRLGSDLMVAVQAIGSSCPPGQFGKALALRISGGPQPQIQTAWCSKAGGFEVGPIVTTSNDSADPIVWIVGAERDNKLHGLRGDNGQEVFTSEALPGLRHFVTILAAAGRLYFAGDGRIFAFGLPR